MDGSLRLSKPTNYSTLWGLSHSVLQHWVWEIQSCGMGCGNLFAAQIRKLQVKISFH